MNLSEFLKIRTNYIRIGIKSLLYFGILVILIFIELFAFWVIYGEGATASRISKLWYVHLILNYLPFIIVGGFLIYKIKGSFGKQEYVKFKTNVMAFLILILLFSIRNQLDRLIF